MERVKKKVDVINEDAPQIAKMVYDVIIEYVEDLDDIMAELRHIVKQDEIPNSVLEKKILQLANALYYVSAGMELVGIKEDLSKSARRLVYNNSLTNQQGGTVQTRTANAEIQANIDGLVQIVFNRAYKQIKSSVDAGYEMLNSLKKIMNKRIIEMELSRTSYTRRNDG